MDEATDSSQKLNNPLRRAKSSNRILRLIAVRWFLALTNHPQNYPPPS
jgi:hypothetical protein